MSAKIFRHGFKAEAERIALELRSELGLGLCQRLEPQRLAEHLRVPILTLHDLASAAPDDVRHLLGKGHRAFSAVTIFVGRFRRIIVTNPAHATTRQMNSICHELGHIVLDHEAEAPVNTNGQRAWNKIQEREADWLAGCLLIPHDAAHAVACHRHTDDQVAATFGVSVRLATWRMNDTGARIHGERRAKYVRRG